MVERTGDTRKLKQCSGGKPVISIITIVYNGEKNIAETISSVIEQSYEYIEYIVVDGASTDNTINIIKSYEDHIDLWISEKDGGVSDAFNKGISLASGDYIQMLNCGDILLSRYEIESIIPYLDTEVVCFQYKTDTGKIAPVYEDFSKKRNDVYSAIKKARVSHQATFVRSDVFQNIGKYDLNYKIRMDFDFFFRAQRVYDFSYHNKPIVFYRTDGISSQLRNSAIFKLEEFKVVTKFYNNVGYKLNFFSKLPFFLVRKILSKLFRSLIGRSHAKV
ncbi:hypothetical protein GCM10011352_36360 [Marinobacterium zhoushanense]|uniref:Glycosyltransferase 2-like domain-containing protein n=1 Tax=Marinobacterium zhoushanense TaxID=1679163 RepID=A0ABQ1KTF0_9GAMM|nr:glycosyltransferase family 2 protein [Marinobacterium zhoushanense]GGC06847.1 hypothetical protein GCM10011352_36360 [Marinobacterium zhoushanense]